VIFRPFSWIAQADLHLAAADSGSVRVDGLPWSPARMETPAQASGRKTNSTMADQQQQ
jgi:hypothetical protein